MHLFHVFLVIARVFARVIAFLAGIGFFASVGKLVPPQRARISAKETALGARKRFFTRMP